jgi:RNA polymerase sigma-70 factor (ECF subfamily)
MMLLHDSRRDARFRDGDLVLLTDQDRSLWDADQIARGRAALDRAVAVAEAEGPEAGLRIADQLALDDYRYLHSARAELLGRLGRTADAVDAHRRALALVHDDAERRQFERRMTDLATGSVSGKASP